MLGGRDFLDQQFYLRPSRESADSIAGEKISTYNTKEVILIFFRLSLSEGNLIPPESLFQTYSQAL